MYRSWYPSSKTAVMVVHTATAQFFLSVMETVHEDDICHLVFAPIRSQNIQLAARAQCIAEMAARSLSSAGVFGVDMADGVFGYLFIHKKAH